MTSSSPSSSSISTRHVVGAARGHVLPDVVRADRQLPVPAVDEHRQLDRARPAEVHQRVHRGPDRPAREQDVVHQDHGLARDVEADRGLVDLGRLGAQTDVVAVEGDVEDPDRDGRPLDPADLRGEAPGQVVTPIGDAHERHVLHALVALADLVGDPGQRAPDVDGLHHRGAHTRTPPRPQPGGAVVCVHWHSLPGLTGPALKGRRVVRQDSATRERRHGAAGARERSRGLSLAASGPDRTIDRSSERRDGPVMEWGVVAVIAVAVIFLGAKLPQIARNVGQGPDRVQEGLEGRRDRSEADEPAPRRPPPPAGPVTPPAAPAPTPMDPPQSPPSAPTP